MNKEPIPLQVSDLTEFTRSLSRQIGPESPSHLKLMNMIARASGFQNLQHMRSISAAQRRLEKPPESTPMDSRSVERTLNQFDETGQLRQWPSKRATQSLALWALWAVFPAAQYLSEKEVNEILREEHRFQDPATLAE